MNRPRAKSRGPSASVSGGAWLAPLAGHWIDAALSHLALHAALVRVTVVSLRGSAPREPGASMLVHEHGTLGTIGGGRLEWHAARAARQMLCARGSVPVQIDDLILGPELGQCCGGRVVLWLERLTREDLPWLQTASDGARIGSVAAIETFYADGAVSRTLRSLPHAAGVTLRRDTGAEILLEALGAQRAPLWIFGAGHVGQALVRLVSELALFDIHWVDSRPELLPAGLPDCVSTHASAAPADLLGAAAADTRYVVLTHDHALDYELCRAILRRGDAAWVGLIGSASKSARFRARLRRDGIEPQGLTCPIGVEISSKLPAAIAIAITAQLLRPNSPAKIEAVGADVRTCDGTCASCGAPRPEPT